MARTFPLHLTHFEKYMLNDDGAEYPMTFVVQFIFSGKIQRDALDSAYQLALKRHPLLRAVVQPAKRKSDCWVAYKGTQEISWGRIDEQLEFQAGQAIDLRQEPGVRLWVRQNDERAVLTGQFHHSTCDGIGSYQFLGDLLWFYARAVGAEGLEELPELDPMALRNRGIASYDPDKFRLPNGKFRNEWGEFFKLSFARVESIRSAKTPEHDSVTFPGIQSHAFSKSEYKQVRLAAQSVGQTTNEAILTALFEAVHQWNCDRIGRTHQQPLCVMVPMDLRENRVQPSSAMNCVTYALLRRSSEDLEHQQEFAETLAQEMTHLKQARHTTSLMNLIAASSKLPRVFTSFLLKRNRCLASAVLSNTGDPTRSFLADLPKERGVTKAGNLILEDIVGVPPMRRNTNVTMSIFTYRRSLKICLRCSPKLFSDQDAGDLLKLLVDKLWERVESSPPQA